MAGWWYITNKTKDQIEEGRIYTKDWKYNTSKVAEALTILNLIKTIELKVKGLTSGVITIYNDNAKNRQFIVSDQAKVLAWATDRALSLYEIKSVIDDSLIKYNIEYAKGYPTRVESFNQNSSSFMIKQYNVKSRLIREQVERR